MLQHFPVIWKKAEVVTIPKSEKRTYSPSKWSTDQFPSNLGKIYERIVSKNLSCDVFVNTLLQGNNSALITAEEKNNFKSSGKNKLKNKSIHKARKRKNPKYQGRTPKQILLISEKTKIRITPKERRGEKIRVTTETPPIKNSGSLQKKPMQELREKKLNPTRKKKVRKTILNHHGQTPKGEG